MKRVLILCNMDPNSNPRPNRMIHWLKDEYEVEVVGTRLLELAGVKSYVIGPAPKWQTGKVLPATLKRIVRRNYHLLHGDYEEVNASRLGDTREVMAELGRQSYDLIVSHDLVLLPLVFRLKNEKSRVMFDAREYYPRNYDDQWLWRFLKKPVNEYLCREYLHRCDKVITVSDGLADEYECVYGARPEVIMSLPVYQELEPSTPKADQIRIVHHGAAGRSRKTELMIELMDHLDDRFTMDLMLVTRDARYWKYILSQVEKRKNVHIVPSVPMQKIIPETNAYDIGLFLVPPTNFNLKHTLPNKLFEYIQARLAVAIGPSIEMAKIVSQYGCGVVAKDFGPRSLAKELNRLTGEKIMELKQRSHQAAQVLHAGTNCQRIKEIVHDLIGK